MSVTVSRLYDSPEAGRRVVNDLEARGVSSADIGFLSNNTESWFGGANDVGKPSSLTDQVEEAAAGAGIGAAVGGVSGLLAGLGVLAIPGLGPLVAAGWLVATGIGAAAGAATGGVIGLLTQAGISESDADFYAEGLRRGGTVVSVRAPEKDAQMVESIMARSSVDVQRRRTAWQSTGWKRFDPTTKPLTVEEIRRERELYRTRD